MALLSPFRALRPAPERCRRGRVRALRRRQHRGGARAGRGQSAELPARHARGDRSAARRRIRTTRACTRRPSRNFEELKRAAPLVQDDEPSLYFYRLRMGTHEQTGLAGLLLARRVRRGPHQEAREDAQGQGRRPHAPHDRSCARRRASCSSRIARSPVDRRDCPARRGDAAALRLHGARRRLAHDLARDRRRS